jgi:hypothetical protein
MVKITYSGKNYITLAARFPECLRQGMPDWTASKSFDSIYEIHNAFTGFGTAIAIKESKRA